MSSTATRRRRSSGTTEQRHRCRRRWRLDLAHDAELPVGRAVVAERDQRHSSGSPCGAASGTYCREVPDVSADADPYTGYVIYYERELDRHRRHERRGAPVGGVHRARRRLEHLRRKVDRLRQPDLYSAAASAYSSDFTDVTSGNNDYTPDGYRGGLYPAGTAYDMASGLGTPNGATLPAALCGGGGSTGNTVTVTNPGNQTTTVGTAVSLQIKATDSAPARRSRTRRRGCPRGSRSTARAA